MDRGLGILFLIGSLAAITGCQHSASAATQNPQPPPDEVWAKPSQIERAGLLVEPVAERALEDSILTSGKIAFDEERVSHVFSPVTGRVVRILANLGRNVKKGDVLAIIQSPDVGTATSDVAKANAELIAAEHDFNRKKDLFEQHATSRADFETAEDNFRKARAERDRAAQKTQLYSSGGATDGVSSSFALRSPMDGEVIVRSISPGVEVQGQYAGGAAVELFTIGAIDRVWVTADLFEVDLPRVAVNAPLFVKMVAYPERELGGRVDWVSSTLDPTTRTARVRGVLDNADRELRPEMFSTVRIVTGEHRAPALPRAAIVRLGDQNFIFADRGVMPDGRVRFERVSVKIADTADSNWVEVKSGIQPGTRVVTRGAVMLVGSQ